MNRIGAKRCRPREALVSYWIRWLTVLPASTEALSLADASSQGSSERIAATENSTASIESGPPKTLSDESAAASEPMRAYVVTEPAYKAYLSPVEIRLLELFQFMNLYYD